jgi:hypothetical protein
MPCRAVPRSAWLLDTDGNVRACMSVGPAAHPRRACRLLEAKISPHRHTDAQLIAAANLFFGVSAQKR